MTVLACPCGHDCAAEGCEDVALRVHQERLAQRVTHVLEDPVAVRRVAILLSPVAASASSTASEAARTAVSVEGVHGASGPGGSQPENARSTPSVRSAR